MNVHAPYIECLGKGNLDLLVGRLEKVTKGCIPQKMVINTMAQSVKNRLKQIQAIYIYTPYKVGPYQS